ncbi:hypothetical protein [Streptomyces sp. NPDC085466]|uniref:hypothetical protein n=1 Tax=Streptomyces sp. NPDC085466 TaxID=3365725 RepID=UPI0037D47F19
MLLALPRATTALALGLTAGGATWAVGLHNDETTQPFARVAMRWTGTGWQAPPQPAENGRLDDLAVGAPDQVRAAAVSPPPAPAGARSS